VTASANLDRLLLPAELALRYLVISAAVFLDAQAAVRAVALFLFVLFPLPQGHGSFRPIF
jgi:hypothetical protein